MTDDTNALNTSTPAAEAAPDGPPLSETPTSTSTTTQEATEATPGNAEPSSEPQAPKHAPWYQKRIDELTKARREAERKAEALAAMIEQKTSPENTIRAPGSQKDAHAMAREIAATERINEAANRTYEAGKAAHADFDAAVQQMAQVADLSARQDFLEAVTSLPNAHEVYYHLGKNPDEAAHVLSLSPVKMALHLAQLSAKTSRPQPASKAPAPITVLGKTAAPTTDLTDDLPMDEWIKRREAQLAKR